MDGQQSTLPVQRISREREAVGLPVATACPAWRRGARKHVKALLHIMGAVDMWLNSNHHRPNSTCSMQAMLLIRALLYLGELNVGPLDVRKGMCVD